MKMKENIETVNVTMRVNRAANGTRRVPLEIERTQTNSLFIVSMGIYFALWLGIAIFFGFPQNFDISFNFGRRFNESIFESRWIAFSAFTALISLSYILLLKRFAKILICTTIFIYCLLQVAGICLCSFYLETKFVMICWIGLIIFSIMLILTIINIIILSKEIQTAVEVIRVSSKIVISFSSSLVFSILPCILYGIVIIFSQRNLYYLIKWSYNGNYYIFFHLINIFGFLWLMVFITGWSQAVLSGCFCTWYWTTHKITITNYTTITNFVHRTTKYHLGTIACGSLMIILRKFIRLSNTFGRLYILLDILLGYELVCTKLETYFMCVNHNAYIMTSSHGTEFFKSGKDAFGLLTKNISNTLVINRVAKSILFLGQILIIIIPVLAICGCCLLNGGGCVFTDLAPETISLIIISGIIITASIFMVLKIAIDSIFLCILEDNEENDGTIEESYFMSRDLKAPFLQNS